jgi:hypothetical protein
MDSAARDLIQFGIVQNDEIVGHANLLSVSSGTLVLFDELSRGDWRTSVTQLTYAAGKFACENDPLLPFTIQDRLVYNNDHDRPNPNAVAAWPAP